MRGTHYVQRRHKLATIAAASELSVQELLLLQNDTAATQTPQHWCTSSGGPSGEVSLRSQLKPSRLMTHKLTVVKPCRRVTPRRPRRQRRAFRPRVSFPHRDNNNTLAQPQGQPPPRRGSANGRLPTWSTLWTLLPQKPVPVPVPLHCAALQGTRRGPTQQTRRVVLTWRACCDRRRGRREALRAYDDAMSPQACARDALSDQWACDAMRRASRGLVERVRATRATPSPARSIAPPARPCQGGTLA